MLKLIAQNGKEYTLTTKMIALNQTLQDMLEDMGQENLEPVSMPNLNEEAMNKIMQYSTWHADHPEVALATQETKYTDLDRFDQELLQNTSIPMIFEYMNAGDYLHNTSFLLVCAKQIAYHIRGKSLPEIREIFGIENDFTPDEEEQIRKDYLWIFEQEEKNK